MKIPSTVKIGGMPYTISRVNAGNLDAALCGSHSFSSQLITLQENAPEAMKIIFLHECVHAMTTAMGWLNGDGVEHNEAFTEGLARQLYQFINDNPEMFTP